MNDVVELGADGWLRGGEPWEPLSDFYAVLGDPVAHSLSPAMQNAALAEREIDAEYVPIRIQADQLHRLKEGAFARRLAGFNATHPLKQAVARLCDGRTDVARLLDSVNTVRVSDGRWLGHNTDSGGILSVLAEAWAAADPPAQAVVLGGGDTGRAAVDALARWGVPRVVVRNRGEARRRQLTAWLQARDLATAVTVEALTPGRETAPDVPTVWVCCLAGGVACRSFLPDAAGAETAMLLDLRYGDQLPAEDPPLGFRALDGLPVLLMQGGLSFAWWFGPPVPWVAMRSALF